MNKYFFITLPLLATIACTSVETLNPEANHVTVLKDVTLTELEKLKKIGSGTCEISMNARSSTTNADSCKNYLRNEAAKRNADFIVYVTDAKRGITSATVEANFYTKR